MRLLCVALVVGLLAGAASAQEAVDAGADGVQYPIGPRSRPTLTPTRPPAPTASPRPCVCDANGDGAVSIEEIVAGIAAAQAGCR